MRISDWSSDVCSSDLESMGAISVLSFLYSPSIRLSVPSDCRSEQTNNRGVIVKAKCKRVGVCEEDDYSVLKKRTEERRVGKECVSKCRSGGSPHRSQKQSHETITKNKSYKYKT